MTRGKRTTTFVLAGAVALASGAYALGSQAGDGDAVAAKTQSQTAPPYGPPGRGFGHPPGARPDLSALANRLGVKEADLRAALEDLRPDRPDRRDQLAQGLADALGIDVAKVNQAFDKLKAKRDDRKDDFAAALAEKLGLSTAKVQSALDAQRDHRGDPGALADALGVSPQKLRDAFAALWRDHGPRGARDHRRGPAPAALAKALGVTPAQLKAAFDKLEKAHQDDIAKLRDQFAQRLADRLHIDVAKVKDALDDFAPPFGRHHP